MQINTITALLKNENLRRIIEVNLKKDTTKLAFSLSELPSDQRILLLNYLHILQKAEIKIPLWFNERLALTQKSYEQSTAQVVAEYKARLFSGNTVLNLSGGLGVDDYALSFSFKKVLSIDIDQDLNEIARWNFEKLSISNVERISADATSWVNACRERFDLIYTDPDRRPGNDRKFMLKDSSPDILKLLPKLRELSDTIALKLSPMADISATVSELGNVMEVQVIALQNEVKELLFILKKPFTPSEPVIKAVNLDREGNAQVFSSLEQETKKNEPGEARFFLEPNSAIIKAGLSLNYARHRGTEALNRQGTFAASEHEPANYFGRIFQIAGTVTYGKAKEYLAKAGIRKANVSKRDFPDSVETLRSKLKLLDGGTDYLFFTITGGKKLMYHCRR